MFEDKYYAELNKSFPNKDAIITEIINLEAILNLPKGTEYFISDIHGEIDGFHHILKTGAGIIGDKIRLCFSDLTPDQQNQLSLLVAYPNRVLDTLAQANQLNPAWYHQTIGQLIQLTKICASKYSRSKVRKALPDRFHYVIEELLYRDTYQDEKETYYLQIINCLIELDQADDLIFELCRVIKHLVIDHMHIVGDIFDRGPHSDQVMDKLIEFPSLDIQWGNHDLLWLGAYCGSTACLMHVLRIATRYGHLYELESAYQINLRPLFLFAETHYQAQEAFMPKEGPSDIHERQLLSQVHQALLILQLKLEDQIIARQPEFDMENRRLLHHIKGNQVTLPKTGQTYPLSDACFQTVDPSDPGRLTQEEQQVVQALLQSYQASPRMQDHMRFLYKKGAVYTIYNQNLIYHGCIPMTSTGAFKTVTFEGRHLRGKSLLDYFHEKIRWAYRHRRQDDHSAHDYLWYAWLGPHSPVYGRNQMTTFERYFIADKSTHKEIDDPYFELRNDPNIARKILAEFGLKGDSSHIINGHTPVKAGSGESPIKADGILLVIDGGLSKAYQKTTSIGGYTLINDSYGLYLVTHQPFIDVETSFDAIVKTERIENFASQGQQRKYIKESTIGDQLTEQIQDLRELLRRN